MACLAIPGWSGPPAMPVAFAPASRLARIPPVYEGVPHGLVMARARALGAVSNAMAFHWAMLPLVDGATQERAWAMPIGTHGDCLGVALLALGTRDRVGVDLVEAVRPAVIADARYMILAHNHPSGYASPSQADAELTMGIDDAAIRQGVILLDHAILASREVYSFREASLGREALWRINR